ncbi:MAG: bifunctional molybdopterin-guanine dinucleotide biosynthesis adaptor protein MobB/molybdopterin molybdotransferase MoeA [Paracoccaceae bacterium]
MKVFGVIGWKNSGKTGLMERLVVEFSGRGISVSTVKHAHHRFDVDQPGKDSYRHRQAGAKEVLLSSKTRWALMHEARGEDEPSLGELLAKLDPVDLVLVEGFKRGGHSKLEVHRRATGARLIAAEDDSVLGLASDQQFDDLSIPSFDLDDTSAIANFILTSVGLVQVPAPAAINGLSEPLANDCFALPEGVDWVPVDDALGLLRARIKTCVGREAIPVDGALGRLLALDVVALRSNPPGANSAVDGFGFAHSATGAGKQIMPLAKGRSAAGNPFDGELPLGQAVRVLTGALLPKGVDTVVLQEVVNQEDGQISFNGPVKKGANARVAGEDISAGDVSLRTGQLINSPELALLSATGCCQVDVFQRLRVGVLSTGDELVSADGTASVAQTFDANRPMLLGLMEQWGYLPVDLGHVGDDRDALRDCLDVAACKTDVILTTGGASAGEEDHMAALMQETKAAFTWRIAIKPGRPMAMGIWQGTPIFGLPGNPVAAFVCTLIFARPAMSVLAGGAWLFPQGFQVPADFEKRKKPGRREYLRARLNDAGRVEVFASEGSGRISGLSWADGLVELADGACEIRPGDLVRYIPYSSFNI